MEKLTVTKVFISDKNKDGVEFKSKKGEKFWKVAVKFDKYKEEWFSCLAFTEEDLAMKLKEGDERLFIVERGEYNNFRMPSRLDVLESRIEALERALRTDTKQVEEEPEALTADEIPF